LPALKTEYLTNNFLNHTMSYVALFIADDAVEVASAVEPTISTLMIPNSDSGIDRLADWLREELPGSSVLTWVASVPSGDGGPVYAWLTDAVPELLLQNPTALKAFADITGANWRSARTLLEFQLSKVW
jgi:hypothetical protein